MGEMRISTFQQVSVPYRPTNLLSHWMSTHIDDGCQLLTSRYSDALKQASSKPRVTTLSLATRSGASRSGEGGRGRHVGQDAYPSRLWLMSRMKCSMSWSLIFASILFVHSTITRKFYAHVRRYAQVIPLRARTTILFHENRAYNRALRARSITCTLLARTQRTQNARRTHAERTSVTRAKQSHSVTRAYCSRHYTTHA